MGILGRDGFAGDCILRHSVCSSENFSLRRGCLDFLGQPVQGPSKTSAAGARAFAKKASIAAGVEYQQILEWMDKQKFLGRLSLSGLNGTHRHEMGK
jgi:hypothetical protein